MNIQPIFIFIVMLSVVLGGSVAMPASAAEKTELTLGSGFHYLEGDYGESVRTYMSYVPVVFKYRRDRLELKGTLSYLRINGPGLVGDSLTPVAPLGGSASRRVAEGRGDSAIQLRWQVLQNHVRAYYLDVSFKHLFPTADENKGLGTGAASDTVQLEYLGLFGRQFLLLEAGYRWRHDSVIRVEVNDNGVAVTEVLQLKPQNGVLAAVGWGYQFVNRQSLGLIWNFREASSKQTANDNQELMLFYQTRLDKHWKLSPYLGTGLNRNSSDFSAGIQWSYRF